MQLQSDKDGFLIGKPLELKDIYKGINTVTSELAEIKELLRGRGEVSISDSSIKDLTKGFSASVKDSIKSANSGIKTPSININSSRKTVKQPETGKDNNKKFTSTKIATPNITRTKIDKEARSISDAIVKSQDSLSRRESTYERKSGKTGIKDTPIRGANGRFIGKNGSDLSDFSSSERNNIGSSIKNIGKNIIEGVGEIANAQADQSDPSLQAMGEIKNIFTPLGRGFGKIFSVGTGGVSRGQDRWYRRFFKQNADKNRVDDIAEKRHRSLLTGIYKKSGSSTTTNRGFLATILLSFLGLLSTLLFKSFRTLMTPLALLGRLFAPLLKVLSGIAKILGLNRIFGSIGGRDRLGGPLSGRGRNGPIPVPSNKPKNKTSGPIGTAGTNQTKTGSKVPKSGGLRGIAKKLPIIGSLITAGLLANDLSDIGSDEYASKRDKRGMAGGAIGGSAGGIGGMVAGASVGATIGSVIPFIGTAIGGAIGGLIGAIGGDKIGSIIGEKFGYWTDDLINSEIGQKMIFGWDVAVETMKILWSDFATFASEKWDTFTQGLSLTWDFVSSYALSSWDRISNGFTVASNFIQSTWATTSSLLGSTLSLISSKMTELGKSVANNVKEYTGVDLPKHLNSLKTTVSGWVDSLKSTVKDVSADLKNKVSTSYDFLATGVQTLVSTSLIGGAVGQAVENVTQRNSTTKEQDENQTKVLNAMLKAGFTESQAIAMTAEVGRENDYNSKYLYGGHTDRANGAHNIGMISWQGDRAKKLQQYLASQGLWKNGKMVQSQEALDAQARFMKMEIEKDPAYASTKKAFANNPNVDPEAFAEVLGKNYIRWAYGQNVLSSGDTFDWKKHDAKRRGYKGKAQGKVTQAPFLAGQGKAYDPYVEGDINSPMMSNTMPELDPNSPEGMMKTLNSFNGMANIKEAMIHMLQAGKDGKAIKRAKERTTAVVPAISNLKAGANVPPAPTVQAPMTTSNSSNDSNALLDDVSRDLSDKRIAHIVTGAYSQQG